MKALLKKAMIWFMWYPLRKRIDRLPLALTYRIGVLGGIVLHLISKDKQRIMFDELSRIFPEKSDRQIKAIARESTINFVLSEMAVLFYPAMNSRFIRKTVDIRGRSHLDAALAEGNGVLLFQAHFGAFQMVMPAIGYSGYRMNQISASASFWKDSGQPELQKKSYDIKADYEYRLPVRHISIRSSLKPVFTALKRNEVVGITGDGGGGKKKIAIPFLGRVANFQRGGVDIALRTGAAIVPAFIVTGKNFAHRLEIHPAIAPNRTLSNEANVLPILQAYARLLEKYVYRLPSHYGFTLFLRRSRVKKDTFPFFEDYPVGCQ